MLDYEPGMLRYRDHEYLGIGGNRMRMSSDEGIYLDESWKLELSYKRRLAFGVLGGWLNMMYGYRPM